MKRVRIIVAFVMCVFMFGAMAADVCGFTINNDNYKPLSQYPGIKSFDFSVTPVRENIAAGSMVDPEYAFRIYSTAVDEYFGNTSTYTNNGTEYKGFLLKNNAKGKCGVRYNKLFRYQDDWIDVKTTYMNWNAKDESVAFVCGGFCKVNWKSIYYVRLKHEFFKAGTNQRVKIKGFFTYYDIDNNQGIGLYPSEITKLWRNRNGSYVKYQTTEEGYLFLKDCNGADIPMPSSSGYDPVEAAKVTFAYQFEGTTHTQYILDGSPDNSFNVIKFKDSKEIPSAIPAEDSEMIRKGVSTADGDFEEQNSVRSWNGEWQYRVAALVPMETEAGNFLDAFKFTDQIDFCLEVTNVKILRGAGTDVTSKFNISVTNNKIVASAKNMNDKTFYGYMYYMLVDVRPAVTEEEMRAHGHFTDDFTAVIHNRGRISYTDGRGTENIDTNQTKTNMIFPYEADITITKRIRKDDLYWDHGTPSFVIRLAGTRLVDREEVEYHKVITFSPDYAGEQGSGEYLERSVTFAGVQEGSYICEEYGTARYKLDSLTDLAGCTAKQGDGGKPYLAVTVDDDSLRKATFVNTKKNWDQYSDSQCVVNRIAE